MTQDMGASDKSDRACTLRVEPQASQAKPLVPSSRWGYRTMTISDGVALWEIQQDKGCIQTSCIDLRGKNCVCGAEFRRRYPRQAKAIEAREGQDAQRLDRNDESAVSAGHSPV